MIALHGIERLKAREERSLLAVRPRWRGEIPLESRTQDRTRVLEADSLDHDELKQISIFTGKVIGVASMLYGFVGTNVPSFCNYARSFGQITECPLDQALLIQKRMFARRGIEQTPADVEVLRAVFETTRGERLLSDEPPAL